MIYLLSALLVLGHFAACIFVINRLHATALPYAFMKAIDVVWYATLFGVPSALAYHLWLGRPPQLLLQNPIVQLMVGAYTFGCCGGGIVAIPAWLRHLTDSGTTSRLNSNHTRQVDVTQRLGHRPTGTWSTDLLSRIPTNQVFQLHVQQKVVQLPRLSRALDGLTITHLSDLHFTGQITRPFYELIVDEANSLDADLVVISGDIIDKQECLPWIPEVLGRLRSRHGAFFVLGNHDLRIRDELGLRDELGRAGLIDLGGRWQLIEIHQQPILLAGNELPWFAPAADLKGAPRPPAHGRVLRIAVAHSPDQYLWAQSYDFDLMLAGHTHGGQIRFPLIGPVFSPSRFGVKYCAGTFYEDPTLMHVSRGIAGTRPLRFNCPPELTRLTLRMDTVS